MTIDHIDKNANNAHDYEELDELLLESVGGAPPPQHHGAPWWWALVVAHDYDTLEKIWFGETFR